MLYLQFSPLPDAERRLDALREARNFLDAGLIEPSPVQAELRRHALASSVHFSTRIEGNLLALGQVEGLLRGEQVAADQDQLQEAINYADAIRYVQDVASQFTPLTEQAINAIHFMVTRSLPGLYGPGRYRTEQNYVVDRISRSIAFRPPPPEEVSDLMREYIEWLNTSMQQPEPVFTAGLAHLNFVGIHPFADGNGRTARVIEALVFYHAGYKSHELVSLEEYFGRDTESYYAALRNSLGPIYQPQERDVAMWMDYYLGAHVIQAEAAVERQIKAHSRIGGFLVEYDGIDENQALALYVTCEYGSLTNRIYRELADVTNQTAVNHLRRLIDMGLLRIIGRGRGTRYEPTEQAMAVFNSYVPDNLVSGPDPDSTLRDEGDEYEAVQAHTPSVEPVQDVKGPDEAVQDASPMPDPNQPLLL